MLTQSQQSFLERFGITSSAGSGGRDRAPAEFESLLAEAEGLLNRVRALPPKASQLLKDLTGPIATAVGAARKAAAKGAETEAVATLSEQEALGRKLDREIDDVTEYLSEAKGFAKRLAETRAQARGHGAAAVEDYLKRLESDDKRRQAAEARGAFDQATIACEAQEARHAAMMQEAGRAANCNKVRHEIDAEIARLESQAPGGGNARPVIETVREMMNDADNFAKSSNWVGAALMMRKARTELQIGTRGLDLMDKLRPTEEATEFTRAHVQILAHIKALQGLKTGGPIQRELRRIIEMTKDARKALPDEKKALHLLNQSRAACIDLTQAVLDNGRYASSFKQLFRQRDQLRQVQQDKCAQPEIKQVTKLLREADTLTRRLDFPAAIAQVDAATKTLQTGLQAAHLYTDAVRPARVALARQARNGDKKVAQSDLAALDAAFRQRDLRRAESLARTALDGG
ncbi:hypothetical protein [Ruegeria jejuensis]|uniref:hypothetical protein n=1 Tax=Ruegeria jejuensis TaxID=3233338 RepID=UPI00355ADCE3